ncbi:MAG: mechanosensitive ion channel family protein [Xanthomonadales bacterium]|nr:mechanosensitive ion channel family protein [Xanthomonadales bacterium]
MDLISQWVEAVARASGLEVWALTVFLVVLIAALADFTQRRVMKRLSVAVRNSENLWDDALFDSAVRPLSLLIWLLGITLAAQQVPVEGLVIDGGKKLLAPEIVTTIRQLGLLFCLAWFLVSFVRHMEENIIATARRDERPIDETTVSALGRIVRIAIIVTVLLVTLDTLGFSIAGLLAAGGIGGLAVGLAARDILANFFGGVTVFIDRPFSVGDWILLKEKDIEGVVENIGWRQTTIRKFDKRPVYIPNAIFTTASVENPSRMTHRRIYETIGLRYDDIGRMRAVTDAVREMLSSHPEIDNRQTLMVQFNAFNASSVDFFIYCMTHTVNWQKYHEVKQDVLLKISDIVARHEASIAYPTRTLKMSLPPELAGLENLIEHKNGENM